MNKYEEKLKQLDEKKRLLELQKQKILNHYRRDNKAFDTKKKIIAGALLISGAEKDLSLRKALLKVISTASERDSSLFTELKEFYSEKKNDEAKPANADEEKPENDSPKTDKQGEIK